MSKPGTERGHIDPDGQWVTDGYIGPDGVTLYSGRADRWVDTIDGYPADYTEEEYAADVLDRGWLSR